MRGSLSRSIGAALLACAVAACSSDVSTGPGLGITDQEIDQGIAADAGNAMATSVDLMLADESASGASGSLVLAPGVSADVSSSAVTITCGGPDDEGWFTCDRTTWRGLDVARQIRFWEGTSFGTGWDAAATDSVNHRVTIEGSFSPAFAPNKTVWVHRADTASMVVDRSGDPVLHVWSRVGVRADSASSVVAGTTRTFHYTAHDTASAVAFAMPRSEHPWPASGTVTHDITTLFTATDGRRDVSKTVTRRAMVTFNGTSTVTLDVGDLTCRLDLATHEVSDCQ